MSIGIEYAINSYDGGLLITIVFFDLDDTIYDRYVPFYQAFVRFFHVGSHDKAYDAFKASNYRSIKALADLQDGIITKKEMIIYRFKGGLADVGIPITDEQAIRFSSRYNEEQSRIKLTENMCAILDCCKLRFDKIGIITNGDAKSQREKIDRMGLKHWISPELIIISGEHNVLKPSFEIFMIAGIAARSSPKEMVMIGDSYQTDVCGAANYGMKTILMDRHNESAIPGIVIPDYVVNSEEELLGLLRDNLYISKYL